MKGVSHPKNDESLNPSTAETIHDVIGRVDLSRRTFMSTGIGAAALATAGGVTLGGLVHSMEAEAHDWGAPGIGFEPVPAATAPLPDRVVVPRGYTAELFVGWGDAIMPGGQPFRGDATETALEQQKQFGMHCDGMNFFPLHESRGRAASDIGLLCVNNEYTQEEILFPGGQGGTSYSIAQTRKSQAAHGVSVVEARRVTDWYGRDTSKWKGKQKDKGLRETRWVVNRHSIYGRRITANTPMEISGPAAGHALMKTKGFWIKDDETVANDTITDGFSGHGTINNCANGITPWGTYLTCEENWNGNFGSNSAVDTGTTTEIGKLNRRYGVTAAGFGYRWHETDPRFDVVVNPNEPNHFGWVVEIDPYNPWRKPVKRTALGRFKHESAQYVVDEDRRVALYMGDDERNEYIYKFVCAGRFYDHNPRRNRDMLDEGTLYVAKFNADLTGQWIPLVPGTVGVDGVALRDNPNFKGVDDAEVLAKILIKTRMAADAVGATMMDRPEWTGARPRSRSFREIEVYCTLTNNNRRGTTPVSVNAVDGSTAAGGARPGVDAANPREDNVYGHIIRWREAGRSVAARTFTWDLFMQNGDTATAKAAKPTNDYRGSIVDSPEGSADFGAPDGLWFDPFGRLWVQTDQAGNAAGDWVNIGANCMVCADPASGKTRRFLTAPPNAEVTGLTMTPDGKTMFVGIQHPGEDAPATNPTQHSNWPQSQWSFASDGETVLPGGRPRSSVVVITKDDGGVIGT